MLGGGIGKGDHASARWDDKAERVVFERQEPPAKPAEPEKPDAANVAETPPSDASKPAQEEVSGRRILSDGEAVVSDPNGLTWAATLVSLAVAIPTAGHAVIYSVTLDRPRWGTADRAVAAGRFAAVWAVRHQPLPAAARGGSSRGQILLFRHSRPRCPRPYRRRLPVWRTWWDAHRQSLTSGNRIEPLVDGEQAYPAMLAAIESARHSVAWPRTSSTAKASGRSSSMRCAGLARRGVQVRC